MFVISEINIVCLFCLHLQMPYHDHMHDHNIVQLIFLIYFLTINDISQI